MPRACFGCGSTANLPRDCPSIKMVQEVQEVRGESDEPEVLYIAHITMQEREPVWEEVSRSAPRQRMLGDFIKKPLGLSRMYTLGLSRKRLDGFRVLEVDEPEDAEFEMPIGVRARGPLEAQGGPRDPS